MMRIWMKRSGESKVIHAERTGRIEGRNGGMARAIGGMPEGIKVAWLMRKVAWYTGGLRGR